MKTFVSIKLFVLLLLLLLLLLVLLLSSSSWEGTEGVKWVEIRACLCTQHGDNALPQQHVSEQMGMFKRGRT
jgi:hypothetical protein